MWKLYEAEKRKNTELLEELKSREAQDKTKAKVDIDRESFDSELPDAKVSEFENFRCSST